MKFYYLETFKGLNAICVNMHQAMNVNIFLSLYVRFMNFLFKITIVLAEISVKTSFVVNGI